MGDAKYHYSSVPNEIWHRANFMKIDYLEVPRCLECGHFIDECTCCEEEEEESDDET